MTQFAKRFLWIAAWTTVLGWIVWMTLLFVKQRAMVEGLGAPWLANLRVAALTANAIVAAGIMTCWVGSIAVWARSNRRGVVHGFALIGLVLLGVFVGALYILAALRTVPRLGPNEAAA